MTIQMSPTVSTLKLGMTDRIIGRLVNMDVNGETAQQDLAGDIFHSLYKGPEAADPTPNERVVNNSLLNWAKSTKAWPELENQSRGNIASSLLAGQMLWHTMTTDEAMKSAMRLQEKAEQKKKEAEQAQREAQMQQAIGNQEQAEQAAKRAKQAQDAADKASDAAKAKAEGISKNPLNKGIMGKAVENAGKEAKRINGIFNGWGHGPGSPLSQNPKAAMAFMQAHTAKIQRIAQLAGRSRGIGMDARRQQVTTGNTPDGYEHTKNISRIVASELAQISSQAHPTLRAIKLAQYGNGGLLGRKTADIKQEAGPFVYGCDVSGSMHGDREESAKGVGLGMAQIAQADDRAYRLFSFSSGHDALLRCASEDDWTLHLKWAGETIHGGTDFNLALTASIDDLKLLGERGHNADVVIGSDGEAMVSKETVKIWQAFKAETGARLLFIACAKGYGSIDQLADKTIQVDDILNDDTARQVATWMR